LKEVVERGIERGIEKVFLKEAFKVVEREVLENQTL
jgi:hypothetical protein